MSIPQNYEILFTSIDGEREWDEGKMEMSF